MFNRRQQVCGGNVSKGPLPMNVVNKRNKHLISGRCCFACLPVSGEHLPPAPNLPVPPVLGWRDNRPEGPSLL